MTSHTCGVGSLKYTLRHFLIKFTFFLDLLIISKLLFTRFTLFTILFRFSILDRLLLIRSVVVF